MVHSPRRIEYRRVFCLGTFAIGGMFTVFVYARMWRRAEVMTDVELIKLGYSGKAANEVCFC